MSVGSPGLATLKSRSSPREAECGWSRATRMELHFQKLFLYCVLFTVSLYQFQQHLSTAIFTSVTCHRLHVPLLGEYMHIYRQTPLPPISIRQVEMQHISFLFSRKQILGYYTGV